MPDNTTTPTQPSMSPSLLVSTPASATGTVYTNGFSKQPPQAQVNGFAAKYVDPTYPVKRATTLKREAFAFDAIEDALAAFARGEFLVVMDDEGRENERTHGGKARSKSKGSNKRLRKGGGPALKGNGRRKQSNGK